MIFRFMSFETIGAEKGVEEYEASGVAAPEASDATTSPVSVSNFGVACRSYPSIPPSGKYIS
ncbi:MAG TPA: hypothetical protein VNO14_14580 [Blastocatellia bacterium]|nr:hypothetical protein [Blastocatellia bacterium]